MRFMCTSVMGTPSIKYQAVREIIESNATGAPTPHAPRCSPPFAAYAQTPDASTARNVRFVTD
jgi:hypothetical protein